MGDELITNSWQTRQMRQHDRIICEIFSCFNAMMWCITHMHFINWEETSRVRYNINNVCWSYCNAVLSQGFQSWMFLVKAEQHCEPECHLYSVLWMNKTRVKRDSKNISVTVPGWGWGWGCGLKKKIFKYLLSTSFATLQDKVFVVRFYVYCLKNDLHMSIYKRITSARDSLRLVHKSLHLRPSSQNTTIQLKMWSTVNK